MPYDPKTVFQIFKFFLVFPFGIFTSVNIQAFQKCKAFHATQNINFLLVSLKMYSEYIVDFLFNYIRT